jgi:hypothetical protein
VPEISEKSAIDPSIVAIAPRWRVSVPQQRCAFLALAATFAMLGCGGSPQSGLTPSPLSGSNSAGTATPSTFNVSGIVRGAHGPLPDASVELQGQGHYDARTDADGIYRFSHVERGEYMLRASSPGYANAEQFLTIDADTARDVSLQPASSPSSDTARYRLYGRITDRLDGSVNGAKVELVSGPDAGLTVFSMDPALYEFRNLRPGTYHIRVSREGYQTRDVQQGLGGDTELNIRLELVPLTPQTGTFEGTVAQLDTGQRLEGVLVEATGGVGAGRAAFTSGAGVFRFELPAGTTRFRWSKEGYVARDAEHTIVAGARSEVQVWLQQATPPAPFPPPPYTFTGTVRDSRRNPVGGAEVWLYSNSSPIDDRRGTGFTDGTGRYTISLQRTAQTVRAMKDGYVRNDASIFTTSSSGTTFATDVTIRKIDAYVLLSPTSIKVGELVRMEGRAELDDGSRVTGGCVCFQLVSSDPSVVAVDGTGSSGLIRGVAPGTAAITGTYFGVMTTLVVRVNP